MSWEERASSKMAVGNDASNDPRRDIRKAPPWLRQVIALIESEAANIEPLKEERAQLPEYIYRH